MYHSYGTKSLRFSIRAILHPLSICLVAGVASAQAVKTVITPTGITKTRTSTAGTVTAVSTGSVVGSVGYNSFTTFTEQKGATVNLLLPTGTNTLLNLVNGSAVDIEGKLNSILNGKIGGNVYFVDPFGVIVGKSGVVNVGSFAAMTPTNAFQANFFSVGGTPSAAATADVLAGTVPISAKGLISVQGRVNAAQNIGLIGGTVDNSGSLVSGAVFAGRRPDFSDAVNVAGLVRGGALVQQNGAITIVAAGDIDNSGTVEDNGAANLNAGSISLRAGRDLVIGPGSVVSAAGVGFNSNGGTIDLSAIGAVDYNGGTLRAGAEHGAAGSVIIDPTDLDVTSNITPNDGTSVTLIGDTITVAPGVVISTRQIGKGTNFLTSPSTGNSGSISLTANSTSENAAITIGNSAELLAEATGAYTSGDITLAATRNDAESSASAGAAVLEDRRRWRRGAGLQFRKL